LGRLRNIVKLGACSGNPLLQASCSNKHLRLLAVWGNSKQQTKCKEGQATNWNTAQERCQDNRRTGRLPEHNYPK